MVYSELLGRLNPLSPPPPPPSGTTDLSYDSLVEGEVKENFAVIGVKFMCSATINNRSFSFDKTER